MTIRKWGDRAWIDEAERRLAAFRCGEVQGVPAEEVLCETPCALERRPRPRPIRPDDSTERKSK